MMLEKKTSEPKVEKGVQSALNKAKSGSKPDRLPEPVTAKVKLSPKKQDKLNSDLQWAAKNGGLIEAQKLIAKGADVNAKNILGVTALMMAAANGNSETVKLLITKGADVNAKNAYGLTALAYAAAAGQAETARLIIGQEKLNYELLQAAQEGDMQKVKELVGKGADVNVKNEYGMTTLMRAACYGSKEVVDILIGANADLHAVDYRGWTAWMYAKENRHPEIVKTLEKHGLKW